MSGATDYVGAIYEVSRDGGKPHFHGTGFLVGTEGFFLSAKHVLSERALADAHNRGNEISLRVTYPEPEGRETYDMFVKVVEEGPSGADVVIGKISQMRQPPFVGDIIEAYGWNDVACFGYPETLTITEPSSPLAGRYLKGCVIRRLPPGRSAPEINYHSYELNFAVTRGMSGAPLLRSGKRRYLVGVCTVSLPSRTELLESSEIVDGKSHTERTVRYIEYGYALRLSSLVDWKPDIAGGKTLAQIVAQ